MLNIKGHVREGLCTDADRVKQQLVVSGFWTLLVAPVWLLCLSRQKDTPGIGPNEE
jgi:hypothetical protein